MRKAARPHETDAFACRGLLRGQDDELDVRKPRFTRVFRNVAQCFGFSRADAGTRDLAPAVGVGGNRDHGGDGDDAAALADSAEPQVKEFPTGVAAEEPAQR